MATDGELIKLIAAGGDDGRWAAAEFLVRHKALIRRRVRHKLSASARRLFDSEDLFSTIARRIDQEVERQQCSLVDERQFWGLINRIGDNYITDMTREERVRLASADSIRALVTRRARSRHNGDTSADLLEQARHVLGPGVNAQILFLRLLGRPFAVVAEALGLSESSARRRWHRLRQDLRDELRRTR